MKFIPWRNALLAATMCLSGPNMVFASGGDGGFSQNMFAPESYVTARDLSRFGQGNIGVVPSTYWRVYQFLAYRGASGQAIARAELDALHIQDWKIGAANAADTDLGASLNAWLAARATLKGTASRQMELEKYDEATYSSYVNCPADALQRATRTLAERFQTGGAHWAGVWLTNQDIVFANCSIATKLLAGKPSPSSPMPSPLPANAPAWLQWDHQYQTAAALFYAGQLDAARIRFQAIAKNSASPWQPWGDYLAARSLIRKATLERGPSNGSNVEYTNEQNVKWRRLLEQAHRELTLLGKTFAPARQLIGWVDARIYPEQRLSELAIALNAGPFKPESARLLSDYLLILDTVSNTAMLNATEPLTAWIGAMQADSASRKDALSIARKQWKAGREAHWLMPLLAQARAGDLTPEELTAAASVESSVPAYIHLQYHLARLAIAQGNLTEADNRVTAVLQQQSVSLSGPSQNRLLGLKMLTDATREGYFQAARRSYAEEVRGTPITDETAKAAPAPVPASAAVQDADNDFYSHLYRQFSLAELQRARSFTKAFPVANFAEAVWTRAVILGDFVAADEFTDELMVGRETTHHLYRRYKEAKGTAAKRDAAMLIMANSPELHPNLIRRDGVGGAWDCGATSEDGKLDTQDALHAAWPRFLGEDARTHATQEMKRLLALPKRSDYLGPLLLDWVQRNPHDAEAPKALHFFIASTRMECPTYGEKIKRQKSYSQQAFELLKKRYPDSEWSVKTKYYF